MQGREYPHSILFESRAALMLAVVQLMVEDRHAHNFEVWMDALTISVNQMGYECIMNQRKR